MAKLSFKKGKVTATLPINTPGQNAPTIEMVNPQGEVEQVPAHQAGVLAALGYVQNTPELQAAEAERQKYGEGVVNELKAGALGVLRGATVGLSDFTIRKGEQAGFLPEGATEDVRKLREYNPDASLTGELGSFALPGLGTIGALGKAGKAASKLAILQTLVNKGGAGLGEVAKRIVGETAGKIVAPTVQMAAEAAAFQAGMNISEESLYDRDLTAEAIIANTGQAAILGGGIGAAVPAALMTGKAVTQGIIKAPPVKWAVNGAARQVQRFFDPDRSVALYAGAMSKGGLLQDTIKGRRFQSAVHDLREGGFFKSGQVELDAATGELVHVKPGELPSQAQAYERLEHVADQTYKSMADVLEAAEDARVSAGLVEPQIFDEVAGAPIKGPKIGTKKSAWDAIKEAGGIDDYDAARADAAYERWLAGKGPKPEPFEGGHFDAINQLLDLKGTNRVSGGREAFDKLTRGTRTWDQIDNVIEELRQVPGLEKLRLPDAIQEALADTSFEFGANVKRVAQPTPGLELQPIRDKIDKWARNARISDTEAERLRATVDDIAVKVGAKEGDMLELHAMRRDLDDRVGGKNWEKLATEEVEIVKDVRRALSKKIEATLQTLGESGVLPKDAFDRWKRLNKLYSDLMTIKDPLDWQRARSTANVNVGGLRWRDMLATAVGGSAGSAIGGPVGAALGSSVGVVNRILQTDEGLLLRAALGERLQQLAWAEKLTTLTQKGITDSLRAFLTGVDTGKIGAGAVKKFGAPVAYAITERQPPAERRASQQNWFKETQNALMAIAADPQAFIEQQSQALQALGTAAPELHDAVLQKQLEVLSYLTTVMPKNPRLPASVLADDWEPSEKDVLGFRRVVQAARDPLSVLEDMRKGTLAKEQVEAVRTLYPKLYEQMLEAVRASLNTPGQNTRPSYQQRLRLGLLFPGTERTLDPNFVASMQALNGPSDEQQSGPGNMTGGGRAMKFAERAETGLDKLRAR
jgi:hypothetical protein